MFGFLKVSKPVIFLFLTLLSVVLLLVYSFSTSPLYVNEGMDSCVFKTIGLAILQGKLPYTDIFDHKGPLLFYINALGQSIISGRLGIFLLQVINLAVTLYCLYLTGKLFVREKASVIIVLVAMVFLAGLLSEGNQCEEWMLMPISVSLYLILSRLVSEKCLGPMTSSIVGFCFGVVFYIRSNDAFSIIGAMYFGMFLYGLVRRQFRDVITSVVAFFFGFLVISAPILILYLGHNALQDLIYGLFGFNVSYTGGVFNMILHVFSEKSKLLLVFIASILFIRSSQYRITLYVVIPIAVISCLLTGNAILLHYYIVFVPVFAAITAICAIEKDKAKVVAMMCMLLLLLYPVIRSRTRNAAKSLLSDGNEIVENYYQITSQLLSQIPVDERDDVWNYNLDYNLSRSYDPSPFSILYHNGIVQCNHVVLWWHYGRDSNLCKYNITGYNPLWVVVDLSSEFLDDIDEIKSRYELCDEAVSIGLFHRKDLNND